MATENLLIGNFLTFDFVIYPNLFQITSGQYHDVSDAGITCAQK